METQLNLFTGQQLRDKGISQAVDNADNNSENWSGKAYQFLLSYIKQNREFMAEDVRLASVGIVDAPPSSRAWGGIIVRAVKAGLIQRVGFRNVSNAKAHCTPASLWGRV